MKRLMLLVPLAAVVLSGCVNVEQKVTLNKDGSGEYDVVYSMTEKTVDQLTALFALKDQLIESYEGDLPAPIPDDRLARIFANPTEDQIREEIGKYEELGLALKSVRVNTTKASRTVRLTVSFTDIGRLAEADFYRRYGFSLTKDADGNYTLKRTPRPDTTLEPPDYAEPDVLRTLTPVYTGFRIVTGIQVPGLLVRSNAHTGTRYAGTWIYDFDADNRAVTAFQTEEMILTFDGTGLELPVFQLDP